MGITLWRIEEHSRILHGSRNPSRLLESISQTFTLEMTSGYAWSIFPAFPVPRSSGWVVRCMLWLAGLPQPPQCTLGHPRMLPKRRIFLNSSVSRLTLQVCTTSARSVGELLFGDFSCQQPNMSVEIRLSFIIDNMFFFSSSRRKTFPPSPFQILWLIIQSIFVTFAARDQK